jgi:hypothetical protein
LLLADLLAHFILQFCGRAGKSHMACLEQGFESNI